MAEPLRKRVGTFLAGSALYRKHLAPLNKVEKAEWKKAKEGGHGEAYVVGIDGKPDVRGSFKKEVYPAILKSEEGIRAIEALIEHAVKTGQLEIKSGVSAHDIAEKMTEDGWFAEKLAMYSTFSRNLKSMRVAQLLHPNGRQERQKIIKYAFLENAKLADEILEHRTPPTTA